MHVHKLVRLLNTHSRCTNTVILRQVKKEKQCNSRSEKISIQEQLLLAILLNCRKWDELNLQKTHICVKRWSLTVKCTCLQ